MYKSNKARILIGTTILCRTVVFKNVSRETFWVIKVH